MKTDPHSLKGHGYLISILSVFLLAVPALKGAKGDALLIACIAVGALLSILGMGLRWIADRKTQHKIDRKENKGEAEAERYPHAA
jgi:hypothetical protein